MDLKNSLQSLKFRFYTNTNKEQFIGKKITFTLTNKFRSKNVYFCRYSGEQTRWQQLKKSFWECESTSGTSERGLVMTCFGTLISRWSWCWQNIFLPVDDDGIRWRLVSVSAAFLVTTPAKVEKKDRLYLSCISWMGAICHKSNTLGKVVTNQREKNIKVIIFSAINSD